MFFCSSERRVRAACESHAARLAAPTFSFGTILVNEEHDPLGQSNVDLNAVQKSREVKSEKKKTTSEIKANIKKNANLSTTMPERTPL